MDSREAWQLDGEDLKSEVLDLVRARHELQSRMVLLIVEMFSREVLGGKGFRAIAQWLHGSTNLEIGECSLMVGLARLLMLEPVVADAFHRGDVDRSEEHTSELQSLMRISYAVFCLKKKIQITL